MNPEIEKIVKERLEKLPPNISAAIQSVSWREKIKQIAKTNNLTGGETESFEVETSLVVLGMESPSNYPGNLSEKVGLSDERVIKIAKEVDEQIITPIIEASKKTTAPKEINVKPQTLVPEIAPEIHPVISSGEKTRPSSEPVLILNKEAAQKIISSGADFNKTAVAAQPKVTLPDYRYDGNKDPYREPLK